MTYNCQSFPSVPSCLHRSTLSWCFHKLKHLFQCYLLGVYTEFSSKWRKSIRSLGIPVLFGEYKKSGYQTLFQEEGCWYDHWGLMLTDVERYSTPLSRAGLAKR